MEKALLLQVVALALLLGLSQSIPFDEKDLASEESLWNLYERWRSHHTVARDLGEKHRRFNVFKENVRYIHEFNKKDAPYKLRLNKFGDMTKEEFRWTYAGSKIHHHRMLRGTLRGTHNFTHANARDLPVSVDWRQKGAVTLVVIDGHVNVPQNNEAALIKAVANQPVSVAIEASGSDFQFYSEGVFNGECGTDLDHGVAIVGYGITQYGTKYWIVKNSWGPEWGERGYIRMQRGISKKEGLCGIAMEASYPIKTSPNPGQKKAVTPKDEL